jgi:hypothetical protein
LATFTIGRADTFDVVHLAADPVPRSHSNPYAVNPQSRGSQNEPFLQIAFPHTIEAIRAYGCHSTEDRKSTGSPNREIPFVLDLLEPARWGHVPESPVLSVSERDHWQTYCLYGIDTALPR